MANEAENENSKSSLIDGLARLSAEQFKTLSDAVQAETGRRLKEAKAKRPPSALSDEEFKAWSAELMERAS